ncbi:hypothetical protein BST81_13050 [Leptolyngbya sp. 'hensonii']|uniref:lactate racemase domain-containing protein n=1 Tax=Leptolyngbya sp. 'hensonii' TaxID=1922337 RepID=UPI00094FC5F4|nr:lactate racemase domain-containing protein [Leptolyngbya sp. 'hensonii']OLP17972.1 hypothetical protein BST81_13050 [Leptolyngbya sp. 'hensonii']
MQRIKLEVPSVLSREEILQKLALFFDTVVLTGRKVLIICEDVTRSTPIDLFFPDFLQYLQRRAAAVTVLFALGTHRPMTHLEMVQKLGLTDEQARELPLLNHNAFDEAALVDVGAVESVPLKVNRALAEHEVIVALGSVLPHRVMGFSGGAKYLCPGVANKAMIDYTHWKSNLFPEEQVMGNIDNPIRLILDAIADQIADRLPGDYVSINCVTAPDGIVDLFVGSFYQSYRQAAALTAQVLFKTVPECSRLLAILDDKCTDFWQGAKAVYNCGAVIRDGGTIVIQGALPEGISASHGPVIEKFGYSTPEQIFALVEAGEFTDQVVVASHMVRVSQRLQRLNIFLASENIDPATCERVNLGYRDPRSIDEAEFDYVVYNPADLILVKPEDQTGTSRAVA